MLVRTTLGCEVVDEFVELVLPAPIFSSRSLSADIGGLGEQIMLGDRVLAGLGFEHVNCGSAKVYCAPEAPEQPAEILPPFPSAEHYDAKLWRFVLEWGTKGALVWNVA